jgi:hypothetical protein
MHDAPESDAGARAIQSVLAEMQVDSRWSLGAPREFTWWPQRYAQHVYAEPPVEDRGVQVSRLVATTTIVRDVELSTETFQTLGLTNAQGAILSGFVLNPINRTVLLACTAKVYDDPRSDAGAQYSELMTQYFANALAAQASQAHQTAEKLARAFKGKPAASDHPTSGRRREADDIVETLSWLMVQGQSDSEWAGAEMQQALATLKHMGALATGSDTGVTAEFPFHGGTALMTMTTTERHATIGNGMLVRLTLPIRFDLDDGVRMAATLNQRELSENYLNEFMGGWCFDPRGFLTFVAFYPNVRIGNGYGGLVAQQMAIRSQWAAHSVFEDPRPADQRTGYETTLHRLARSKPEATKEE